MKLQIGDQYEHTVHFTKEDVLKFADLTKDTNPLHTDENFARNSIFKSIIVPGFLSGAVFSKVFGTLFPGIGTIYLYQEMKFKKPVFIDETYSAHFHIKSIDNDKRRATVACKLVHSSGIICIEGDAVIMHPELI